MTDKSCGGGSDALETHDSAAGDPTQPHDVAHAASYPLVTAGRRALLAVGVGLATGARAQSDPTHDRPKEGDLLVKADDTTPTPLTPDSIPLGDGQVMAWPMDPATNVVRDGSRLNKVLLLRLDPAALDAQTAAARRGRCGRVFGDLPAHGLRGGQLVR